MISRSVVRAAWRARSLRRRFRRSPTAATGSIVAAAPGRPRRRQSPAARPRLAGRARDGRPAHRNTGQQARPGLHPRTVQAAEAPAGEQAATSRSFRSAARGSFPTPPICSPRSVEPSSPTVLIVSAHYDHLGIRDGDIYHGADDNASGVAAMLAVARWFSRGRPGSRSCSWPSTARKKACRERSTSSSTRRCPSIEWRQSSTWTWSGAATRTRSMWLARVPYPQIEADRRRGSEGPQDRRAPWSRSTRRPGRRRLDVFLGSRAVPYGEGAVSVFRRRGPCRLSQADRHRRQDSTRLLRRSHRAGTRHGAADHRVAVQSRKACGSRRTRRTHDARGTGAGGCRGRAPIRRRWRCSSARSTSTAGREFRRRARRRRAVRGRARGLGFTTRWVDGAPFKRAGHLVAERPGPARACC